MPKFGIAMGFAGEIKTAAVLRNAWLVFDFEERYTLTKIRFSASTTSLLAKNLNIMIVNDG